MNTPSRLLRMKGLALAFAISVFALPGLALAGGYVRIDDIKGELTETRNSDPTGILSWSWGETNNTRISGIPTGKRQHKPIRITKPVDKATPLLQQASTSGQPIPAMEVALPKKVGRDGELVKYKLMNVYVTSYSVSSSSSDGRSVETETFTLEYEESTAEPVPARK